MNKTRAEHLAWCKQRAMEYVNEGDISNAVASMTSDLGKHPDTASSAELLVLVMPDVMKGDLGAVRHWIDGFN